MPPRKIPDNASTKLRLPELFLLMKPEHTKLKAKHLADPKKARADALQQIRLMRTTVSRFAREADPQHFLEGAKQLCALRAAIYENLNQFPHEALVLEAQRELAKKPAFRDLEWYWHPRQTSGPCETDLMGWKGNQLVVVAEANTSAGAKGTIRARIKKALQNLAEVTHPAVRFFYCYSEFCGAEAVQMVKNHYADKEITVVVLPAGQSK
jgi:hypothetical protein